MNKEVYLKDFIDIITEQINSGKKVSFVPRGNSMQPMLRNGKDMVVLEKPGERLHLFDVALYFRVETGRYVIHRVVGFQKDGSYIMLGDNNAQREYNIRPQDIIGVVSAFYRNGKMYSVNSMTYRFYVNLWFYTRPLRTVIFLVKNKLSNKNKSGDIDENS